MKHIISKYKIKLVKEEGARYECENTITSPDVIEKIARKVLEMDRECEEVGVVIALNTKNKVLGTFEVSRGSLNSAIIHPREVFKRLLLLNANGFVFIHNHSSGNIRPSKKDLLISERLKKSGEVLGIDLIDSCIISNSFLSMKQEGII